MADRNPGGDPKDRTSGARDAPRLQVLISHSAADAEIAERLITLIRSALNLSGATIRCTSVDGYKLPIGAVIEDKLRREIYDAKVFIALLTPNSLASSWVLLEIGARWGFNKLLLPLLYRINPRELPAGPLSMSNSLSCGDEAQMYQFIDNLAELLAIKPERPAVFRKCLKELVELSADHTSISSATSSVPLMRKYKSGSQRGLASSAESSVLKGFIDTSIKWGSAWLELATPRDFFKGERLVLTLGGVTKTKQRPAEKVLVRLVQIGDDPSSAVGIITPAGIPVPDNRTFEVTIPANYPNVVQISVHGGEAAWNHFLGEGNGPATLIRAEVISAPNKSTK